MASSDFARTSSRIFAILRENRLLLAGLAVLFCVDFGFVALHFARELAMQGNPLFSGLHEVRLSLLYTGSYGDQFSRFLAVSVSLSLAVAYVASREPVYALASGAYLMISVVATFRLHHPVGKALGAVLGIDSLMPNLSGSVGAVLVLGIVGGMALTFVMWGSARSSRGPAQVGLLLAAGIAGLGLFSGGLRVVNIILSVDVGSLSRNMMAIEEAGELFVLTAAFAVAVVAALYPRRLLIGP